jgi:hypothetical protein
MRFSILARVKIRGCEDLTANNFHGDLLSLSPLSMEIDLLEAILYHFFHTISNAAPEVRAGYHCTY